MNSVHIYWDEYKGVMIDEQERDIYIRDIPQKWLPRICDLMVENSFRTNRLYDQLKIHDIEGVEESYRHCVNHVLHNECSIMVIDEETNEIYGVALLKWMSKEWRSWTIWLQMFDTLLLFSEFMLLSRMLVLKYDEEHPEHEPNSLHLFEYYLHPTLNDDPVFMHKFFYSILEVARHMLMPRVSFVAALLDQQQQAEAFGFHPLSHLIYSLVEDDGVRTFQSLRDIGEMYMVLYEYPVEPIIPFYNMPPPHPYDEEDRLKHEPHTKLDGEDNALSEMDSTRRSLSKLVIK
uniref:Acetate kinase n=1 Tax=Zeugodacus cucurbitae TaxID=28588 RepID=A0A0A1WMG5_ZEUCU